MKTIRQRKSWKFNSNDINVWDNFFTDECLNILKHRVLYGKYFDKKYDGYYAIDYSKNEDYLSELIAHELSTKLDLPEFQRALGLKVNHSNLCSEITLPTNGERTAVCCLSSVNLEEFDSWSKVPAFIPDLVRMLDNVLEYFIKNVPV